MATRPNTNKEKFFDDLFRLDVTDEDDEQGPMDARTTNTVHETTSPESHSDRKRRKVEHRGHKEFKPSLTSTKSVPEHYPRPDTMKVTSPPTLRRTVSEQVTSTKFKSRKPKKNKGEIILKPEGQRIFKDLVFYWIPNDNIAGPRKARIKLAIEYGGTWCKDWDNSVSHIIIDSTFDPLSAKKMLPQSMRIATIPILSDTWISESISSGGLHEIYRTRFQVPGISGDLNKTTPAPKIKSDISDFSDADQGLAHHSDALLDDNVPDNGEELDRLISELQQDPDLSIGRDDDEYIGSFDDHDEGDSKEVEGFVCMMKNDGKDNKPNSRTIEVLQKMANIYDRTGDNWRCVGYRKAISALQRCTQKICTKEQALTIPGIGDRLAAKIEEIVTTNKLKKLESFEEDADTQLLQLFMGIYGAGLQTAQRWIAQGCKSLGDLHTNKSAELTPNQKVGLDHYDDFQQRIPRNEVKKHGSVVQEALFRADKGLKMTIGGSYRRGNVDSGDIDILITKQGATMEHIRTLIMNNVVPYLKHKGFLKVALADCSSDGSKWHGASVLPGSTVWRRIDLLFVPWDELGAALLYFTGNDIFNRSLRLLASRKGMRLNQHGLYANVMRGPKRTKVNDGKLLEGHSERRILEILGVPWRPPEHRKC